MKISVEFEGEDRIEDHELEKDPRPGEVITLTVDGVNDIYRVTKRFGIQAGSQPSVPISIMVEKADE